MFDEIIKNSSSWQWDSPKGLGLTGIILVREKRGAASRPVSIKVNLLRTVKGEFAAVPDLLRNTLGQLLRDLWWSGERKPSHCGSAKYSKRRNVNREAKSRWDQRSCYAGFDSERVFMLLTTWATSKKAHMTLHTRVSIHSSPESPEAVLSENKSQSIGKMCLQANYKLTQTHMDAETRWNY